MGLTSISVGSVQRSVILPAPLRELVFTGGSPRYPEPDEAAALDVSDGLGAGPVDDDAAKSGDWLATLVPGRLSSTETAGASPGLSSSNLALRGLFALSFVGYAIQGVESTSKEHMPLKRPRQHYTVNKCEVYAPSSTKSKKAKGRYPSTIDLAQCHQRGRT